VDEYTELSFEIGSMSLDELREYAKTEQIVFCDTDTSEALRTAILNKYEEKNASF
jgi:hypothetical protein